LFNNARAIIISGHSSLGPTSVYRRWHPWEAGASALAESRHPSGEALTSASSPRGVSRAWAAVDPFRSFPRRSLNGCSRPESVVCNSRSRSSAMRPILVVPAAPVGSEVVVRSAGAKLAATVFQDGLPPFERTFIQFN